MGKEIVFLFSGQGSQYFSMGKELFKENLIFRNSLLKQDEIAKDILGESIIEKIYPHGPTKDEFCRLRHTHPAVFMIQYALFESLVYSGVQPSCILGMSLGEMVAHAAAGCISLENSLCSIIRQAKLIEQNCPRSLMYAVLDREETVTNNPQIREFCHTGLKNYDKHFVTVLPYSKKDGFETSMRQNKVSIFRLPIEYGFHSSLIQDAERAYKHELQNYQFKKAEIPIISCLHPSLTDNHKPTHFWNIMRNQINIGSIIGEMEKQGNYIYVDAGPSGTMSNFVKYNLHSDSQSEVFPIISALGSDNKRFEDAVDRLSAGILQF